MTRAIISATETRCHLELTGHADGHPDVCAAISCLVQALEGYLHNFPATYREIARNEIESGRVSITVEGRSEMRAIFRLIASGLVRLEATCPNGVKVEFLDL